MKAIKTLELDKILSRIAEHAALDEAKGLIINLMPSSGFDECKTQLDKTNEAVKLLFEHGVKGISLFTVGKELLERLKHGASLSPGEILNICNLLKSARLIKSAITAVKDDGINYFRQYCLSLFSDSAMENEINSKIKNAEELYDNASPKLSQLRCEIKKINEQIRLKLQKIIRENAQHLQESVVTLRQDRFVIPVKSECRGQIKGLIHDRSASGASVFVEPEIVFELNNSLKIAHLSEKEEIERILNELSIKLSPYSDRFTENIMTLAEMDAIFAKAAYSVKTNSVMPLINKRGYFSIIKGRHPLIDPLKVVPVNIEFGSGSKFLLLTGPNTGGKTVTLKLVGLFSLLTMCGIFIPAAQKSEVAVFDNIFCDIGDEQSIEQSLSTFSSHMTNIINILDNIGGASLILIDELGAGTDPEEGCALALSVLDYLLSKNCCGIITTHFQRLKEYAFSDKRIVNACMDFDSKTYAPLYKLNIGMPGSSNAVEISKRLGLKDEIVRNAENYLSGEKIAFDKVIRNAEQARQSLETERMEINKIKQQTAAELESARAEKEKLLRERENLNKNAQTKTRQIINERTAEAEEILKEIIKISQDFEAGSKEIFRARTLKNRLEKLSYIPPTPQTAKIEYKKLRPDEYKKGDTVYLKALDATGEIITFSKSGKEARVLIGNAETHVKIADLYFAGNKVERDDGKINLKREITASAVNEINIIGKTADEALGELEYFIDAAVLDNISEVKIIHGVGRKILKIAVECYLKTHKNIAEYRSGKYGEGEIGVTFAKLK